MTAWIELDDDRRSYEPRDQLRGEAGWELAGASDEVELRLFWYTEGKGSQDVGLVETQRLGSASHGRLPFSFQLPAGPCSFSGTLLSIVWALELVVSPGLTARVEFVMGPGGREIVTGASAAGEVPGPTGSAEDGW